MRITEIKVNGVRRPLGFAMPCVNVSFKVGETHSKKAENIRISLSKAGEEDILAHWEGTDLAPGGTVLCDAGVLTPRTAYTVRVSVTGDAGDSAESETGFETGKMDEPWSAQWIAAVKGDSCHPVLKKTVTVGPGLVQARLYAAGVGMFEAYVNGEKLGEEYLKPGVTNYETRVQVITFPVETLKEGKNELSFLLGKGWGRST